MGLDFVDPGFFKSNGPSGKAVIEGTYISLI